MQLSLLKKLKTGKPANETDAIDVIEELDENKADNKSSMKRKWKNR